MHLEIFETRVLFGGEGNQPTELDSENTFDISEHVYVHAGKQEAKNPLTPGNTLYDTWINPVIRAGFLGTGVALSVGAFSPNLVKSGYSPKTAVLVAGTGGAVISSILFMTLQIDDEWLCRTMKALWMVPGGFKTHVAMSFFTCTAFTAAIAFTPQGLDAINLLPRTIFD